jgi:hypothetical protein
MQKRTEEFLSASVKNENVAGVVVVEMNRLSVNSVISLLFVVRPASML